MGCASVIAPHINELSVQIFIRETERVHIQRGGEVRRAIADTSSVDLGVTSCHSLSEPQGGVGQVRGARAIDLSQRIRAHNFRPTVTRRQQSTRETDDEQILGGVRAHGRPTSSTGMRNECGIVHLRQEQ